VVAAGFVLILQAGRVSESPISDDPPPSSARAAPSDEPPSKAEEPKTAPPEATEVVKKLVKTATVPLQKAQAPHPQTRRPPAQKVPELAPR
jgi:hypothetical protein